MFPFRANFFGVDGPGKNNLMYRWQFQSMLNLCGLGQKNQAMPLLRCEKRNNPMRQRLSACLLIGRIKNKPVLQLSHDHHLGNGIIEPLFYLFDHVLYVCVDQAVKLIRAEPEPRHSLQETIRAAVRATARHHKLPESEAHNLRILSRPSKLADE